MSPAPDYLQNQPIINPSINHHSHTKPTTKKEKRKLPTPTWHETCLMYVCTQRMLDMKAVQGTKGWDQRKKQGKVGWHHPLITYL
jgi:hypothetical protein